MIAVALRRILPVCVLLVLLAPATSVFAAEQTIDVCTTPADWYGPADPAPWSMAVACPGPLQIQSGQFSDRQTAAWRFPYDGAGRIVFKSVSFDLSGGDGSDGARDQYVAVCNAQNECTAPIRPAGPADWTPRHHALEQTDGELPVGAGAFHIVGACYAIPCAPGTPLSVANLRISFEDDSPPTVGYAPEDPLEELEPPGTLVPRLAVDGWNSATTKRLPLTALDSESGVRQVTAYIGGYTLPLKADCGRAGRELPKLCPAQMDVSPEFDLQLHRQWNWLKEGENFFSIVATDGAENESALLEGRFLIDSVAPVFNDLRAAGVTRWGWQASEYLDLDWTNVNEDLPTATQSGVAQVRYRLVPPPGVPAPNGGRSVAVDGVGIKALRRVRIGASGLWKAIITTYDAAGNRNFPQEIQVGVDPGIPAAPEIADTPAIGANDLLGGKSLDWTPPPSSISGICGYAISNDSNPASDPGDEINVPGAVSSAPLYVPFLDGERYVHLRAISCAGVPGRVRHKKIAVDVTPPSIEESSPVAGHWYRPGAEFRIASTDEHGVVETSASVDGGDAITHPGDVQTIRLSTGRHHVAVTATDGVGNVATRQFDPGWDDVAPDVIVEHPKPDDPAMVRALVHDALSGIDSAYMQYRRIGDEGWRTLGSPIYPRGSEAIRATLEGRMPDDRLAAGDYELRVMARDAVGNQAAGRHFADGTESVLTLPLRGAPGVEALISRRVIEKRCRRTASKRVCVPSSDIRQTPSRTLDYGGTALVTGVVRDAKGKPLGGARLDVHERKTGATEHFVLEVRASADGRFAFRSAPGPSRRLFMRFAGSETLLPGVASVKLLVRAGVTLNVKTTRRGPATKLNVTGRVLARGAVVPTTGRPVAIQYRRDGSWYELETTNTDTAGRFGLVRHFYSAERPVRWTLRATAPWTEGWVYETGVSRSRRFLVP